MKDWKKIRIIYMGTPEFAVAGLETLLQAGCNIVAVVTAADKPAGRGMEMQQTAVKKFALQQSLPVLQPEKLKSPVFLDQLSSYKADLQIVVAFRMLPELVWNMPPMGTVNLHGSLLPQYRGAAPINWAIINGETQTGVTSFLLKHEIDTGNILLQEKIDILPEETAGQLHDRMKLIGAKLLLKTVQGLAEGKITEQPQSQFNIADLRHAPKLYTETCRINFSNSAQHTFNFVRGLSPYPAAFTYLKDKKLKIFSCNWSNEQPANAPGNYETDGRTFLRFACADGYISVLELQLEGKKKMQVGDFLRGFRFN